MRMQEHQEVAFFYGTEGRGVRISQGALTSIFGHVGDSMPGPVLFCYDGSEGSRAAMAAAAELVARPAPAVVLTVWQPATVLLARAGGFGAGYLSDEDRVDAEQAQLAGGTAEEGVERG
jgi:hypothetical protein